MEKATTRQAKLTFVLFIVYLLILIWAIIFKLQFSFTELPHFRSVNRIPFAGSVIINNRLDYDEIILNMAAFIPFGLYLSMLKPDGSFFKKVGIIAGVSLLFELSQFVFAIGATDITDLLSNTLGGAAGVGLYWGAAKLLKDKTNKVLNILALVATVGIILLGLTLTGMITYQVR